MATEPLLAIHNLCVDVVSSGRSKSVIKQVGLSLSAGQVLCLIGESGCGKSMTCLSVMDLLPAKAVIVEGTIQYKGRPTFRCGKDVGMMPQNPSSCFDPVFSIKSHFRETLAAHGLSEKKHWNTVLQALSDAGFHDPESVLPLFPFQMSGGMLQRVMIALAMVTSPGVLLADEPTTDLDMPAQSMVLDLLDHLRRERNIGLLLVTHDLSVVARIADTVAVMRDGRIVESGSVQRIFDAPTHPYTVTLLDAHFALHHAFADAHQEGATL
ncbi:ATP-binding cassette domain-containing protein [Desulfovibrio inopinatus]|uniref:ATP-binding cassette domain-containing protein n=1 Tax=Desulfovibrio inopinatus TaxID=102109 RepID=UPI000426FDB7|nr:ABC transporter ATP-binding protein [Desulfovibrio inopinatus]